MDVESFRNYCLQKKHVEECFPFDEVTLVFKVCGKMFALVGLDDLQLSANLKCDPEYAIQLREEHPDAVFPGYHMHKAHWNTVLLEGGLDDHAIRGLVDQSYDLVVNGLPRKIKVEYGIQ
jgi:predicted DNA-binding protein (MmcQ/YjbR family)